ncbi:MAG: OmpA family protein [Campylobacterota bacterium]|nr:OmpA family protein [Campylobacterota bacterium]
MKVTYKNILFGLIALGLLSGCTNKEVEYDSQPIEKSKEKKEISDTQDDTDTSMDNSDSKIDGINTFEESSVEITDNISKDESLNIENQKIDGINSVESKINGETILLNSVHFAFDTFTLNTKMREIATQNAVKISNVKESYDNLKIKIEGNCDEWGTDEYNYALGLKRAKTAKDTLIADGIEEDRIILISYGESNPICTEKNVDCWKMNRRVDYNLLP